MEKFFSDSLVKGVIQFLFVPESILSVVFLVIFIICLIYGMVKVRNCNAYLEDFKANALQYYEKEKQHINQKQFLTRLEYALAAREIKIIDLPNVFISIGILGTFIGLGVAIHGASDLLGADSVDINKLNSVLNIIAFKFQMSVWGTFFSLLFQKFIAESYFVNKAKTLASIAMTIYADAVNYSMAMEWQLAELQGIRAGQTEAKITFAGELKDIQARQNAFLNGLNEQGKTQRDIADKQEASSLSRMAQFKELFDKFLSQQSEVKDQLITTQENMKDQLTNQQKDLEERLTAQQNAVDEKITSQQNTLKEELIAEQKQMIEDQKDFTRKNADLIKSDVAGQLNQGKNYVANLVNEQKDYLAKLFDQQNSVSHQLAEQEKELLGDVKQSALDSANSVVNNVNVQLEDQRKYMTELIGKQNDMSMQLAEQQKALTGDVKQSALDSANSVIDNVSDQLEQQRKYMTELVGKQNDMNMQLADQQKALIGDVREFNKNNSESVLLNFAQQLEEQRKHMEELMKNQNEINQKLAEQQKMLMDSADASQKERTEFLADSVEQQLVKQRAYIEKLIAQQSQLNEILLGDMQKSSETNSNYMREGILQQIEKYKNFAEELANEQKQTQKSLEEKLKELIEHIDSSNKNNSSSFVDQQNFFKALFEKQNNLSNALIEDIQRVNGENADYLKNSIAGEIAKNKVYADKLADEQENAQKSFAELAKQNSDNIAAQKEYMEKLFDQQSQLSKALLGNIQKSGEEKINKMHDGMLQQMEEYKNHAENLSKEQKQTQKSLEEKLAALNAHIDKSDKNNDMNIAELRKAMDLLQKTLESNSKALNDIIADFYNKQSDLDDLRRTEIMGIAESFNTLLHQEGKNPASWRKQNGSDNANDKKSK